jgi:NADH-quinone oxidoreductase subunit N
MSNGFTLDMLQPIFSELFLAIMAMGLLIFGALRGNSSTRPISYAAVWAFIFVAIVIALCPSAGSAPEGIKALEMYQINDFTKIMKVIVALGMAASVALSVKYMYQEGLARFEFPIVMMFSAIGMMIMISANNLLLMYVGLELQSLSLYVLAAFHRERVKSSEAGMKYFVLGALSSGMLLFGISMIYGFTASLDYDVIHDSIENLPLNMGVLMGMIFILAALAFKISAAPFHMWTPDVYEGAPTPVTALFAMVPKVAAMALLIGLLFGPFASVIKEWQQIVWFLSAASMFVGAFAALMQTNIKRLMAYSSIGNMGYALMAVVAGTQEGIGAVIVFLIIYVFMSAGVFSIILSMRRNGKSLEQISDLSGLSKTNPAMAFAMTILMFSMAGIPPLAGFFSKLVVFNAAIDQGFITLAVLGVLSSVISAYYYLRIIKVMYFDAPVEALDKLASKTKRVIITVSVVFTALFIFAPDALIKCANAAAASLF